VCKGVCQCTTSNGILVRIHCCHTVDFQDEEYKSNVVVQMSAHRVKESDMKR
jgi:hypothetical protein